MSPEGVEDEATLCRLLIQPLGVVEIEARRITDLDVENVAYLSPLLGKTELVDASTAW